MHQHAHLFSCIDSEPITLGVTPRIDTPLGSTMLGVAIGDQQLSATPPHHVLRLPHGAHLLRWDGGEFTAELLLWCPRFELPPGMSVDGCRAGMWRLQSHLDLPALVFSARWDAGYRWNEAGPDTGEGLDAWTWSDGQAEVSIGTEDAVFLQRRALRSDHLPQGWAAYFGNDYYRQDLDLLSERGLSIRTAPMQSGELCQFQFVIAWARAVPEELGTWCAVERSPDEILAGAQCE